MIIVSSVDISIGGVPSWGHLLSAVCHKGAKSTFFNATRPKPGSSEGWVLEAGNLSLREITWFVVRGRLRVAWKTQ
eukprot:1951039-Amphidinium_carterae.1